MVIKIIGIILFLIGFNSCHSFNGSDQLIFPEVIRLNCKEKKIDDAYFKYPFRIRCDSSCIYVMDLHPTDYYCHQIEYPLMKYRQGFVKRGEAPDEFLDAENIRIDHNSNIWVLDANRMKITGFDYQQLNNPDYIVGLNKELIRSLDFEIFNDSIFIAPDYTGENRLCFINKQGEIIKKSFTIPTKRKDNDIPDIVKAQAWRSFLSYNTKTGILAMVTQLGQIIEIYDIKNDSIINIIHNEQLEPQFITKENYAIPSGIMGYSDVYVGDENIYAVFWGYSFNDIRSNKIEKEGGCYIHVFDLYGNPVKLYILDRYITGFCVDEKKKKIIALDVNSNQPIIEYSYL